MRIRDIIVNESLVPMKLPTALTGNDMGQLGANAESFNLILQDASSKQALENLCDLVRVDEEENEKRAADASPFANLYNAISKNPQWVKEFTEIVQQANRAAQVRQAKEQQAAQGGPGAYGNTASGINPSGPTAPQKPLAVGGR